MIKQKRSIHEVYNLAAAALLETICVMLAGVSLSLRSLYRAVVFCSCRPDHVFFIAHAIGEQFLDTDQQIISSGLSRIVESMGFTY